MALAPGTRVGPYAIVAPLGAGGMGEVYRARDTQLDRDVALKILPEAFASDADRLARFAREAKTLAALNHPNIAHIYGFEQQNGANALVMELVEGEDLAERCARGPIALDEALAIAGQIANALEAAHEQGVIHRDLKPANVKVRSDGAVKVLDFGLAKTVDSASAGSSSVSISPTLTTPAMTQAGVILGTAAYMSPEQAKGRAADKRSDMWAFGCVLYEMLTGTRAYAGDDVSETLAFVLTKEPDWNALPAAAPAAIRTLLRRCLTKDRKRRLESAADARLEIEDALSMPHSATAIDAAPRSRISLARYGIAAVSLAAIIALASGYAGWMMKPISRRAAARFVIPVDAGSFTPGRQWLALSPDGTRLAYAANNRLYLRDLNRLDAVVVAGTDDVAVQAVPRSPFFSPDSRWLGFWQAGQLRKVSVTGGAPVTLCALENSPFGASWAADNTILVAALGSGVFRVSADGGTLEPIITLDAGQRAHGPQLLPDGRTVLFTLARAAGRWDDAEIVVQSLADKSRKTLITGADGRYLPTGHLVYAIRDTVFAVPFDARALRIAGTPVPVVEGVRRQTAGNAVSQFTVSSDGTLAYVPAAAGQLRQTLVWVDRSGREEAVPAPVGRYLSLRLAPDGTRVVLDTIQNDNRDIWMWDFRRGTMIRVTSDPTADGQAVWTHDGKRVIFSSDRTGAGTSLFWQTPEPNAKADLLLEGRGAIAYTMSGSSLVVHGLDQRGGSDLMILEIPEGRPPSTRVADLKPLVQSPFEESNAAVSPDGRWLAYQSNSSGAFEVYVQPFPKGDQIVVSTAGGGEPVWAHTSRELYYRAPNGAVMAVPIGPSATLTPGSPTQLFAGSVYAFAAAAYFLNTYDVSPDGQRFLMIKNDEKVTSRSTTSAERIVIVQNWFDELRSKIPVN